MDSIIFDVDGTMWDSTHVIANAWNQIIRERLGEERNLTDTDLKAQFGKLLPDIAKALFPDLPEQEQLELIDACCHEEHLALLKEPPTPYDGIEEMLKQLSSKYRLFLVSNCQAGYIEVFLEATRLGHYFTDHLCPGVSGNPKSANILSIIDKHNLKGAVYVGDTYGDYIATKQAGIPFVYAAYGFGTVENPDYTIQKPLDLLDIL